MDDKIRAAGAGQAAPRATEGLPDSTWAAILDTTLDAIITVDATQRIRLFNRAASAMFGWPTPQMLGQPLDRLLPPASRAAHAGLVAGYAQHGKTARTMGRTQQLTGLHADGTEFAIEASVSRVGEGDAALMTVVVRDARLAREAEEARQRYITAEAAHKAKTAFLSRMSHELRTPLNAVVGMGRLLEASARDKLSATELGQLSAMCAAGQRLRSLVDDLLAAGSVAASALPGPGLATLAEPAGQVLYVEDEPVNAMLVQELLSRWSGVRLTVAPDGRSGLDLALRLQPDLILLDMHLPDMNGLQVLRQLRDDERTRRLRVAALSAGGTADEVAATLAAGALHYWTKPINFSTFLMGLRGLLQAPSAGPTGP
jgi:PAS domain S-box-containing protein